MEHTINLPDNPELEALRQSIFRLPEFQAWRTHIQEKRRELTAKVASNEADALMQDYVEFIETEHLASRPVAVVNISLEDKASTSLNPEGKMILEMLHINRGDAPSFCPTCKGVGYGKTKPGMLVGRPCDVCGGEGYI